MKLKSIHLRDFRNYANLDLSLNPNINVFIGDNAQGKTNLLESIYFLSTGRSHRIQDEKLCIRSSQSFGMCRAVLENNGDVQLKVVLHDKGKTLFYQNQPLKKSSEFIGKMNAVMFSPSDMDLFETSPKARRKLIDVELGKINPFYMDLLSQYLKVLKERNLYLKGNSLDDAYLEVLTTKLVDLQCDIIRFKTAFIDRLNQIISHYYQRLSISNSVIRIHYSGSVDWSENIKNDLLDKYQKSLDRDKWFKMTHIGVHRDDFEFYIDENEVVNIASQGQRRLIIVALKCSLIEVIEEMTGFKPILLLDDVFSELDIKRREALFEVLHQNTQTIITTTDLEDVRLWTKDHVSIFEVSQGRVVERSRIDE